MDLALTHIMLGSLSGDLHLIDALALGKMSVI